MLLIGSLTVIADRQVVVMVETIKQVVVMVETTTHMPTTGMLEKKSITCPSSLLHIYQRVRCR